MVEFPITIESIPGKYLCFLSPTSPRLSFLVITSNKVARLEANYAKESEKLELLRLKIQVARGEKYLFTILSR
jgi:hypothetical protein